MGRCGKTLNRSSEADTETLSASSLPSLAQDKPTITLKTQSRPGASKSSRQLTVASQLLTQDEPPKEKKIDPSLDKPHPLSPTVSSSALSEVDSPSKLEKENQNQREKSGFRFLGISKSQKKEKKNGKSKTIVSLGKSKK